MEIKLIKSPFGYDEENLSPIEKVLTNRGIKKEDIVNYLNADFSKEILNFNDLDNIEIGVETIENHYKNNNNILIQVDCDVDGYTSAALLYNYLKKKYDNINLDYQVHDDKTHGLEITEDILNNKYQLILVPDAGSNQFEEHKKLKDLGIDIIILDHHDCEKYSKNAIVINNQLSDKYTNKNLSGVGVVWQFIRAVEQYSSIGNKVEPMRYLDLVAVGNCGDMMSLRSIETKCIIQKGFRMLEEEPMRCNKFLMALIQKQNFYFCKGIRYMKIAFYLIPFINAVVRSGNHEERIRTFEAFLDDKCEKIVPSTKRGCKGQTETILIQMTRSLTNIKNRQDREVEKACLSFDKIFTNDYINNNSVLLVNTENKINKNLNGLLANKLCSKYQKPVMVLGENDGKYSGSFRSTDTNICHDFRKFVLESGYAIYSEGHPCAGGVCFTEDNLNNFIKYANKKLNYENKTDEIYVDFVSEAEMDYNCVLDIAKMDKLWGKDIEECLIAIKDVKITSNNKFLLSKDKNPTLKIILKNGLELLKFKINEEFFDSLAPNDYTITIADIVGTCGLNEWNGKITPQIIIKNIEIKGNLTSF